MFVHAVFSHLNTHPQLPNDKLQAFSSARLVFGIIVQWKCRSETAVVPSALQVGAPCGPDGVLNERVCYKSADLGDCVTIYLRQWLLVGLDGEGFSRWSTGGWGGIRHYHRPYVQVTKGPRCEEMSGVLQNSNTLN